jgi:hypothetical protein
LVLVCATAHAIERKTIADEVYWQRGPLVYALPIAGETQTIKTYKVPGFADYVYAPRTNAFWDYAVGSQSGDFRFINTGAPGNPWITAPLRLKGKLLNNKTGDLRWGFVPDPCVHTRLFEEFPDKPGQGHRVPRLVGEQYLPMISGWYRAKPDTWTAGYIDMGEWPKGTSIQGAACDNDVHEIFKCMGEIALNAAYVVENADGSLETWNCTAQRGAPGPITAIPAEAVASRVHFNLKNRRM